jgi:hypothetical protein
MHVYEVDDLVVVLRSMRFWIEAAFFCPHIFILSFIDYCMLLWFDRVHCCRVLSLLANYSLAGMPVGFDMTSHF